MRGWSDGVVEYWSDGVMEQRSDAAIQHSDIPIIRRCSFLLLLLVLVHCAFFDSLPVFQFATDGLVTAGNDFLAFLQAVPNFHAGIIGNAAFDLPHLFMIASRQKTTSIV